MTRSRRESTASTNSLTGDDRAVSIAITHVLTIAITTILVAMLVTSAGGMLETETDRSAETSLETIGERLAGEVGSVDRLAPDGDGSVTVVADHPRTVANSGYTVEILDSDTCNSEAPLINSTNPCLELTATDADVTTHVPVSNETALDTDAAVPGGTIEVRYDEGNEEITLEEVTR
ncbi:DUF7266 family protein [Natrarchaeobaculum aegyptiacum]|uniref:Uncharacterized protein n=1 Tax=Natrarchaeobaculum aegyptiacum TaxID=745377 RepID=A0A2Z2HPG5_9EURY|nr:hypothetical protein [Natrarchaeobaculum aegyptiacum]ARS88871.1 hypothetical protein B1756_03280 [Natrarchaeobaculum aegyptiacum]